MKLINRIKRRINIIYTKSRGMNLGKNAFIHSSVEISNPGRVTIGENSIIYKQSSIYVNSDGRFSVGNKSHIAPFGYLLIDKNELIIGNDVAIGSFCSIICHSNNIHGESKLFSENHLDGDIIIGNNVFIGTQCSILPGTIIEDNVVIASNSVVKGRLKSGNIYGGSPAKKIKEI